MSQPPKSIVIIGGGVIGLTCAWRLAQAGIHVTLLEARCCGQGGTLASLGALWPANPLVTGPLQNLHRESLWHYEAFIQELSAAAATDISFKRLGRLEILNSEKAAARAREEAHAACQTWPAFPGGGDKPRPPMMEYLTSDQVEKWHPEVSLAPHGALVCRATAQVAVQPLIAALRAACLKAGVAVHEKTHVVGTLRQRECITAIATDKGDFPADAFLFTTGAWTALFPELKPHAAIRPVKGQGIALQMNAATNLQTIVKSGPTYLIPWHEENEILVGSTTEPDANFDETPTESARLSLAQAAAHIMPSLAGAPILRHWAGLRPQNPAKGHPPLMGPLPNDRNVYLCTGHYKTGIGMAPIVSRLMAQTILSGDAPIELTPFAIPK